MRDNRANISSELLDWYDTCARELPWRVPPELRAAGHLPDPYHVWLSEIMLQQTTVAVVKGYFERFVVRWPEVRNLALAADEDVMAAWAGLGYYARARNLLKCARKVTQQYRGKFPTTEPELLKLPGIGPYTAAAIAAIAFDHPAIVVDGNAERVMARLHAVPDPLPGAKPRLHALAAAKTPKIRAGDYAQAVMDLGATVCTPRSPSCGVCPWSAYCVALLQGRVHDYPRKTAKKVKPVRMGTVYVAKREDGAVLLERRPNRGLLGGMLGWPGSVWSEQTASHEPPISLDWAELTEIVRHTFTHFHLRLTVKSARAKASDIPAHGAFVSAENFNPYDLPSVMRKVWDIAK